MVGKAWGVIAIEAIETLVIMRHWHIASHGL